MVGRSFLPMAACALLVCTIPGSLHFMCVLSSTPQQLLAGESQLRYASSQILAGSAMWVLEKEKQLYKYNDNDKINHILQLCWSSRQKNLFLTLITLCIQLLMLFLVCINISYSHVRLSCGASNLLIGLEWVGSNLIPKGVTDASREGAECILFSQFTVVVPFSDYKVGWRSSNHVLILTAVVRSQVGFLWEGNGRDISQH